MAKTAAVTQRPPESIISGTPAIAEVAREVMELANYALIESRQVLFSLGEHDPLEFPNTVSAVDKYFVPAWVDEDCYELEVDVWATVPENAPDPNTARVIVDDGTTAHVCGTLAFGNEHENVSWVNDYTPASGMGQVVLFTISIERLTGTTPGNEMYALEIRLRAKLRVATTIPSPGT